MSRLTWCGTLGVGAMTVLMFAGTLRAQDAKPAAERHDAKILRDALKDVVNAGAELFNKYGDHAGCYRLYQGALISIKPFLGVTTQKEIDEALTEAETLPRYSDRAFALRKTINAIRARAAQNPSATTDNKDKTPKKDEVKQERNKSNGETAKVSGSVTFEGKPAPAGYFTLVSPDHRRFSTFINQDGRYAFRTAIPVGRYAVAIEQPFGEQGSHPDIPARYRSEATSGLTLDVHAGEQVLNVILHK